MKRLIVSLAILWYSLRFSFAFVFPTPTKRIPSVSRFYKPADEMDEEEKPMVRRAYPKIVTINNMEEYKDFLLADDRLCLVKFHASWCKSCKLFGRQFERIASNIGDLEVPNDDNRASMTTMREGEIRLAQIEYGANPDLCKKLGVKKVPSIHFLSKGQLVDSFPSGPKKITKTLEKLNHYRSLSLDELALAANENILDLLTEEEEETEQI